MDTNKMREQFEAEAKKHFVSVPGVRNWLSKMANGDYQFERVHAAWIFWQASREAVVVELPDPSSDYDIPDRGINAVCEHWRKSRAAIEAQGLKVKS